MVTIRLIRSTDGAFRSCLAEGHAGYAAKGEDIACAGVSVLLRTVSSLLASSAGINLEIDAPERGVLAFRVKDFDKAQNALLMHCESFLETGLSQLQEEFPDNVSMRVQTENQDAEA